MHEPRWRAVALEDELWEPTFSEITALRSCWEIEKEGPSSDEVGGIHRLVVQEAFERHEIKDLFGKNKLRTMFGQHLKGVRSLPKADSQPEPGQTLKILGLGDSGVGKTCTLIAYESGTWPSLYLPLVLDKVSLNKMFSGALISLDLYDSPGVLPGRREFYDRRHIMMLYPETDVLFLCFSLVSRSSFESLEEWVREIKAYRPETPFILAGTKLDVLLGQTPDSRKLLQQLAQANECPISFVEAVAMARKLGASSYVSYSSLTKHNHRLLMEECVRVATQGDPDGFESIDEEGKN